MSTEYCINIIVFRLLQNLQNTCLKNVDSGKAVGQRSLKAETNRYCRMYTKRAFRA